MACTSGPLERMSTHPWWYSPGFCLDLTPRPSDGSVGNGLHFADDASLLAAVREVVIARAHVVVVARHGDGQRLGIIECPRVVQFGHLTTELICVRGGG